MAHRAIRTMVAALALAGMGVGCGRNGGPELESRTSALLSAASLELETRTASCVANQAQDLFEVINTGSAGVKVSDITIKLWVDDTSGNAVVPHVWTGGCLTNATGCFHQVSGVTATATSFAPSCGPDPNHQANWEITISNTDPTVLAPGVNWTNIQTALNLANYSNFSPGTGSWFSPCLTASAYAPDSHFAVYDQGNLVFSSGIPTPACRSPQGAQAPVRPQITPAMAAAPLVGPVPASMPVSLSIGLQLQNSSQLAAQTAGFSDPTSPTFGQFLTPDQFTAVYAPSAADYQKLTTFAQSKGLTVFETFPNRLLLTVQGTAAQIEQAFFVNLNFYARPDGTTFYGPDREPTFDSASTVPIFFISGLSDYFAPKTPLNLLVTEGTGSGDGGNFLSADIRKAYASCTSMDGSGQTIGIVAGAGFSMSDIQTYESLNGMTKALTPTVILGDSTATAGPDTKNIIRSVETAGDIEMVKAIAPGAQPLVVVYGGSVAPGLNEFASKHPEVKQVSTSFTFFLDDNVAQVEQAMSAEGISFFFPSGDDGAYPTTTQSIVFDPRNVADFTVVGGTKLTMNSNGLSYQSETTWDNDGGSSGGGPIPLYDPVSMSDTTTNDRNVPDVSMLASSAEVIITCGLAADTGGNCVKPPATGQSVITGVKSTAFGTSLSSPLWAGFMALVNQQRVANGLATATLPNRTFQAMAGNSPLAYQQSFNDIADGSNNHQVSGTPTYTAVPGYDLATGFGTPKCRMLTQLASAAPTTSFTVSVGRGTPSTCAIRSGGAAYCWGDNTFGQLGNGTTTTSLSPVPVTGLSSGVIAIAMGDGAHACAARSDGSLVCWGNNFQGQLGNGTTNNSSVPVSVAELTEVVALAAGFSFTCALRNDGTVWCWGFNDLGELGNGTSGFGTNQLIPKQVMGLSAVTAIDAANKHACAVLASGGISCWGENEFGQLGNGNTTLSTTPVSADFAAGVQNAKAIAVAAGNFHTCALYSGKNASGATQPGFVSCWGDNNGGVLGPSSSSLASSTKGVAVAGTFLNGDPFSITNATAISAGAFHTCALLSDGAVFCWGANESGENGTGTVDQSGSNPGGNDAFSLGAGYTIPGLSNPCLHFTTSATGCRQLLSAGAVGVYAGSANTCVLTSTGVLQCWGQNQEGQLGDGTTTSHLNPTTIPF